MRDSKSIMQRAILLMAAIIGVVLMSATSAYAGGNDFKLERLCSGGTCGSAESISDFKALARAYGSIFAPMQLHPASTIGEEGFEISAGAKLSFATEDAAFWRATNKNNPGEVLAASKDGKYSAPDVFSTIQLQMRKGLPFSLEVEGEVSWLADSEMFYVGAGLRWAVTEGWWFLPDISVGANVGTLVGASQLSMINVNLDVAMSYTFGIAGVMSITPYGGYSLLTNFSSSRPLVLYVEDSSSPSGQSTTEGVFDRTTQYVSRGFVGVQLKGEYFIFDAEGEFGKDVMSVGLKIGALF